VIAVVTNVITSFGVVASLAFVAFQARQLVKQTRLSNGLALLGARYNSLERLHAAQTFLIENPSLRQYFYSGVTPPDPSTDTGARVHLAAEMVADAADYGLMALEIAPPLAGYEGWRDYAQFLANNSPVVRQVVADHPAWYVRLTQYARPDKEMHLRDIASRNPPRVAERAAPATAPPTQPYQPGE
jgi:hypothetical protein